MGSKHTEFWIALLNLGEDADHRIRLWNGYLGWKLPPGTKEEIEPKKSWPKLIIEPPDGGWPELTEVEKESIENLAGAYGGHPKFEHDYMDFEGHTFSDEIDFSGLILVHSNFRKVQFKNRVSSSDKTRFYGQSYFDEATFEKNVFFNKTCFDAPVSFAGACFKSMATFLGVDFMGGASFNNAKFESGVMFNDSKFEERFFSGIIGALILVDFTNATFMGRASFRETLFGNDERAYSRRIWPERRVDFTNTKFMTTTDFRKAAFGGVPAFFNATLHEDTDFGGVDWKKAETKNTRVDYAIRAWERLELIMSRLEKPLDRHRFFRLKMRARRRTDGWFLWMLNWLFEATADYGWGVGRAFGWWIGHWTISGFVLFVSTNPTAANTKWWELLRVALSTGFANAHAFLYLTASEGYLAACRKLLETSDEWGLLNAVGTTEAVLGPIFLFLLLLTLRNRFRLA